MPRRRTTRNTNTNTSSAYEKSIDMSSTTCLNNTNMSILFNWSVDLHDEFKTNLAEGKKLLSEGLNQLELFKQTMLFRMKETDKKALVDLNDERLFSWMLEFSSGNVDDSVDKSSVEEVQPPTTVKRRSRSARPRPSRALTVRSSRLRSISVDNFKTPQSRKQALQKLTTASKYTVSKPERDREGALLVRRMMQPDEEAISVRGSPLLVNAQVSRAMCTIPLQDGLVMNLEAREQRPRDIPILDSETQNSINLLMKQLKWIQEANRENS